MKNYDRVEPIFNIDEEIDKLLINIDIKLDNFKISDKQKRKILIL